MMILWISLSLLPPTLSQYFTNDFGAGGLECVCVWEKDAAQKTKKTKQSKKRFQLWVGGVLTWTQRSGQTSTTTTTTTTVKEKRATDLSSSSWFFFFCSLILVVVCLFVCFACCLLQEQ